VINFTVTPLYTYRVDIKTNLTDDWKDYALLKQMGNYLGNNTWTTVQPTDYAQPVHLAVPLYYGTGFVRVYAVTNQASVQHDKWPNGYATNHLVPFTITPPKHN
jgi:hypothetical protein